MPEQTDNPALHVAAQLEQAASVAGVKQAAEQIDAMIVTLHSRGVAVESIARQVCELNAKVFARLWSLLAPAELVRDSCVIVMGSEGRGEQVFKTDQDNALLLRDGARLDAAEAVAQQFIATLIDFGYPRCPGDIMLSNPLWRQPVAGFRQTLGEWMFGANPQGPMNLAIFLDAAAVAGDAGLLVQAQQFVHEHAVDNDAFFARFARAADQFSEPGGWWQWLRLPGARDEALFDLKKLGTFPIVHGVRSLALQHRIGALPTTQRLRALVEGHHLPAETAQALGQTLHALMTLKLEHNLRQRQLGQPLDNLLRREDLDAPQREQLHAGMKIVKRFRQTLRRHFRLDAL